MATALAYPESKQGKRNKETSVLNTEVSDAYLKHARFVLRHCRDKADMELLAILVIPVMTPLAPRLWTPRPHGRTSTAYRAEPALRR